MTTANKPYRIGVDMDGVLCDFTTAMLDELAAMTGRPVPKGYVQRTWSQWADYRESEVKAAWERLIHTPFWWQRLRPLTGAPRFLADLTTLTDGGTVAVTFITSRPSHDARRQSVAWLRANGFAHDPQVFVVNRAEDKGHVARLLGLHMHVDDYWVNLQAIALHSPSTIPVLFCQPYNEPHRPDFVHVASLQELYRQVWDVVAAWAGATGAGLPSLTAQSPQAR